MFKLAVQTADLDSRGKQKTFGTEIKLDLPVCHPPRTKCNFSFLNKFIIPRF